MIADLKVIVFIGLLALQYISILGLILRAIKSFLKFYVVVRHYGSLFDLNFVF